MASELVYKKTPATVTESLELGINTIQSTLIEFKKSGIVKPTLIEQRLRSARSKATGVTFSVDEFKGKLYSVCLDLSPTEQISLNVGNNFMELTFEKDGRTQEIIIQQGRVARHEQFV